MFDSSKDKAPATLSPAFKKKIYLFVAIVVTLAILLRIRNETSPEPVTSDVGHIRAGIKGARQLSSNVDVSDLTVPQHTFATTIQQIASADTTDGLCHKPFKLASPPRLPAINEHSMPVTNCWIDRPDALAILERKVRNKVVTEEEAANLRFFMDNGYMIIDNLGIDPQTYGAVDKFLDEVWRDHPSNLLVMNPQFRNFLPAKFSDLPANFKEGNGSKIMEAHAHNPALLKLILNKKLHHYMTLIYDDIPVATQSLFFRVGASAQLLHRDPWYVQTRPPGNMMASWVALEDIHVGSGELEYIPGSHKLTYLPLGETKDFIFNGAKKEDIDAHIKDMWDQVQAKGLKTQSFAPKKGQALIWHANLIHGGSASYGVNATKTRKSFVVHYDMLRKRGAGRGVFDGEKGHKTLKLLRHD
eukprot:gene18691-13461_t